MKEIKNVLVGCTGFVGTNLWMSGAFDAGFHSRNIEQAYGLEPDLLVYAGLRAEKFLANKMPERDMELIEEAKENIRKINPRKVVLISTVDVYKTPVQVDEDSCIDVENLHPYGYHRYLLEQWVREHYQSSLIVRLPALYGENLKKNFIFDYITRIPSMLKTEKYDEIYHLEPSIDEYYEQLNSGFYQCKSLKTEQKAYLKSLLSRVGFSSLLFTDSRSRYQFYPLSRLWDDIEIALEKRLSVWNPATEPVGAGEVYNYLCDEEFVNELPGTPAEYNYYTKYAAMFGGNGHYIMTKEEVLTDLKKFVDKKIAE